MTADKRRGRIRRKPWGTAPQFKEKILRQEAVKKEMGLFQNRSKKEKLQYHSEGEKRILAKTKGTGMTQSEKDARSAGWMAHQRESTRAWVWASATEAEREALKTLRNDKSKKTQYWALEKSIKDRANAAKADAKGKKK